ncbi:MAG: hypothetical protein HYY63_07425 [Elusimicrobia bacterium]|nr:hypothetical protein [Elusimicrobiota bacterium]
MTIVSVFTKRPQVWGAIAKWIVTFMQGQELRIQGQELKMFRGLFQGKLGGDRGEIVIPKETLGLDLRQTEEYRRRTLHFNFHA